MRSKGREVDASVTEGLFTAEEVAELLKVSPRMVLMMAIPQVKLGARTIRYRLSDVYDAIGVENPNL